MTDSEWRFSSCDFRFCRTASFAIHNSPLDTRNLSLSSEGEGGEGDRVGAGQTLMHADAQAVSLATLALARQ